MRELSEWIPDQNDHCETILDESAAMVECTFSVPALMVSCWACLANEIERGSLELAVRVPAARYLAAFGKHQVADVDNPEIVPWSPKQLVEACLRDGHGAQLVGSWRHR